MMEVFGFKTSFVIQEFVPRRVYETWGNKSIWFIDPRIILFAQWLKTTTGSVVTINDWCFGGKYQYSGFRPPDCRTGAKLSDHRFGRAIDVKVKGWDPEDIRQLIRDNWPYLFQHFGVTTIELDTATWTHVGFRFTNLSHLLEIKFWS